MFPRQAVKIISCLSAAVILDFQMAAAQSVPQPAGDIILHQCEKKLARDELKELLKGETIASDRSLSRATVRVDEIEARLKELLTGSGIAGVSYKAFKVSNVIHKMDVGQFLEEHSVRNPNTIRKWVPRIRFIVGSKGARVVALVGMLVGGVMMVIGYNGKAEASTGVGSSEILSTQVVPSTDSVVPAWQPTDKTADRVKDFENTINREFGDKSSLAIWFVEHSIVTQGDVIFSRLQACSDEKEANPGAAFALRSCLAKRTIPECLFEQEPTKNTLKNILSQISVNNDEISWDPRKFEGD